MAAMASMPMREGTEEQATVLNKGEEAHTWPQATEHKALTALPTRHRALEATQGHNTVNSPAWTHFRYVQW